MTTRRQLLQMAGGAGAYALTSRIEAFDIRAAGVGGRISQIATGSNVVASVHPLASRAAMSIFSQGGNAIDAAVTTALTLGVVDGHNSGIGGGCLILIRTAKGTIHAIDGREKAPAAATPEMYLKDGSPSVSLSQTGPLAIAVPGQIAALHKAHQLLGSKTWSDLFLPAIKIAREGYEISSATHHAIAAEENDLRQFEASRSLLLHANGKALLEGELLRQADLAETLRQIANNGPSWFYNGEFASRCSAYIKWLGGVLTKGDFENYRAIERTPILSSYRGYKILGFPTPSSGGIHIAQMLNILEHFDISSIHHDSPARFFHVLAESMKLAFADRAHWLGDSDFVDVPGFLIDPEYARSLAKKIQLHRVTPVDGHGTRLDENSEKKHTTHFTTADAAGNWVAITNTVNTTWGSKVMVPGTGVMLNNEMDDFSIAPGVPNAFGLLGSKANAVAPNKRPLSSMSPTIVLQSDGKPWLTCGAAGGPKIINATLQNIVRCIDLQQPINIAIASARIHQQWRPDVLHFESGLGGARTNKAADVNDPNDTQSAISNELESMGHSLKSSGSLAIAQGIQATQDGLLAASDPRTTSSALATS